MSKDLTNSFGNNKPFHQDAKIQKGAREPGPEEFAEKAIQLALIKKWVSLLKFSERECQEVAKNGLNTILVLHFWLSFILVIILSTFIHFSP